MKQPQEPVFEPMPESPQTPDTPGNNPANHPDLLKEARSNIIAGLLWCAGGLAFSFLTYFFATEGGRYIIATGAIIWGILQACKGLFTWLKIKYQSKEYTAFWRMTGAAVCTIVAVGWLYSFSSRLLTGEEVAYLDNEQVYTNADAGIRFTVPAGYSRIEETTNPETEKTYATCRMSVWNDEIGFMIEGVHGFIPPEITSVTDIRDYCAKRDSSYYDKEIIAPTRPITVGEREMLCSEGRSTEEPTLIYTVYDLINGQSLITIRFCYDESAYGKRTTRERIENLLGRLELDELTTIE